MDKEDVDPTFLSDTLKSIGLTEFTTGRVKVWSRKKTMDLCVYESEEYEDGYRRRKGLVVKKTHGPVFIRE